MSTATQSVADALEGVASWRTEQEALHQAEIVEVEGQLARLRADLVQIQAQIGSLESLRGELGTRDLTADVAARSYARIFDALRGQYEAFALRADLALAARQERLDAVLAGLPTSEVAARVAEYIQFKEQVEGTLKGLPESYRTAIMAHHQGVSDQIRGWLARQLEAEVAVDAPVLEIDVVYGIDAPNGSPELLLCVLPIADAVFTAWADRPEDLATALGARVVQGIYETTRQTGPAGAMVECGGHRDLLAIEVDLEGAHGDVERVLGDNLTAVLASAPELAAAKVRVRPRRVDADFLLLPDTGEEA